LLKLPGIILLLLFCSCASRMTPEGGKKDVTAPVLTTAFPENSSVNFKEKEITLVFDEYVQLVDLSAQLVVSPLMEPAAKVTAYKNKITIALPDTLLPSTTYSFSFGKSIVDVHESNILDGFRYVFSTGEAIDSLSVSGKIIEAATAKPVKQVTVMLYRTGNLNDSILLKRKPDYFARTDESGVYTLKYLAAGTYVLIALDDKNGNYQYDDPSEEAIAFSTNTLTLPPDVSINLGIANSLPAELRLKRSTRIRKTAMQLVFNRPVDSLEVTQRGGSEYTSPSIWNIRRDTLTLFTPDTLQDSLIVFLKGDRGLKDTVAVRMITGKSAQDVGNKGILLSYETPSPVGPKGKFKIESLNPLASVGDFSILEDSVEIKEYQSAIDKTDPRIFIINYDWKPGKFYNVKVLPGQIKDLYGYANDSLDWKFRMPDDRSSGELVVTVIGKKVEGDDYLLQVCSEDFKVFRQERFLTTATTFTFIPPGNYRIRLVKDINRNGRWDESDFKLRRQPEPTTVSESIQVRASWTLEKDIVLPE
jgi:uncharacterized protein (DUF2141 family)